MTLDEDQQHFLFAATHVYPASGPTRMAALHDVRRFFQAAKLPLPHRGEYHDSALADGSQLILLEDYGVTLRVTPRPTYEQVYRNLPDHPFVLQPLGKCESPYFVYEIFPGIVPGRSGNRYEGYVLSEQFRQGSKTMLDVLHAGKEHRVMLDLMDRDGIHSRVEELGSHNRGYIPVRTKDFPRGFPLILDGKWVQSAPQDWALNHPWSKQYQHVQRDYFAPARAVVAQAWHGTRPDASQVNHMWQQLAALKQQGLLKSEWADTGRMGAIFIPPDDESPATDEPKLSRRSRTYAERVRDSNSTIER